jgi:hypothetical protein
MDLITHDNERNKTCHNTDGMFKKLVMVFAFVPATKIVQE